MAEEGKKWCKQHAPSTRAAKLAAMEARYEERERAWRRADAIKDARDKIIKAVKSADGLPPSVVKALAELLRAER